MIRNNYSVYKGAGIFSVNAPAIFNNCLIENNYSESGNGAGLYAEGNCYVIDGSIFSKNATGKADTLNSNGGALFMVNTDVKMVNTVF